MNILTDNLRIYRKICVSKRILYQYFVGFCPASDSFLSENIVSHYEAPKS